MLRVLLDVDTPARRNTAGIVVYLAASNYTSFKYKDEGTEVGKKPTLRERDSRLH